MTDAGVELDCAKILDTRAEPEEDSRPTTSDETGYAGGGRRKAASATPKLLALVVVLTGKPILRR